MEAASLYRSKVFCEVYRQEITAGWEHNAEVLCGVGTDGAFCEGHIEDVTVSGAVSGDEMQVVTGDVDTFCQSW